jgi:hypothetical protein
MGTVTFTDLKKTVFGDLKAIMGIMTLSNSYATNGETIAPSDLGLDRIENLFVNPSDISLEFDKDSNKILAYDSQNRVERFTYFAGTPSAAVVEMWRAPFDGDITDVMMTLGVGGTGGGPTVIDVNKGIAGTSIFTTKPSLAHDDADGSEDNGTIDAAADDFAEGDIIELEIDAVSTGGAANMTVTIEFTGTGEVINAIDLSGITVPFIAYGR